MYTEEEKAFAQAWVGSNERVYKNLERNWSFSWCSLFWGSFYMFSRKMYIEAIIGWLISIVVEYGISILNLPLEESTMINLLFMIGFGCAFYPLYKRHILAKKRKLENMDFKQQLEIAKKKGGQVPVAGLLGVIILMFIVAGLKYFNEAQNTLKEQEKNSNNLFDTNSIYDSRYDNYLYGNNNLATFYINGATMKYDPEKFDTEYSLEFGDMLKSKDEKNYFVLGRVEDSENNMKADFENSENIDIFTRVMKKLFTIAEEEANIKMDIEKPIKMKNGNYRSVIKMEMEETENDTMEMRYCYVIVSDTKIYYFCILSENDDQTFKTNVEEVLETLQEY